MLIASRRGPHDQVFVILIAWVGEFRHVDIVRPNPFHDFCEVGIAYGLAKGGIDVRDQLTVCLAGSKT